MSDQQRLKITNLADVETIEQEPWESRVHHNTVYDAIEAWATQEPDRMAIQFLPTGDIDDDMASWTYAEFAGNIRQCANMFRASDIERNDVVSFLVPPLPQSHYGLWGAAIAGIASPINFMLEPAALADIINGSGAKILVAYDDDEGFGIWAKVEKIRDRLTTIEKILCIRQAAHTKPIKSEDGVEDFDTAHQNFNAAALDFDPNLNRDDTAFFVHTGGTTGTPKLAKVTHGAILFKTWSTPAMQGLLNDEVLFGAAPLFHIGGVEPSSAVPFANGMTIVIPGALGFRNKDVLANYWKYFKRFGITRLYGVPTSYTAIANVPIGDEDISMIRDRIAVGSAPLSGELAISIEGKTGVKLANLYGLTEAAAAISIAPPDGEVRHGSCGIRYPYVQIKIVKLDESRKTYEECAIDESGEIIIKGPCVSPGYLSEIHNEGLFTDDGFLITGDIGRHDAEGYLWITGRSKDIIIRGGHNIDPQIVEESLFKHPAVQIAGAVGKPDSYAGELPVAYVQFKEGAEAGVDELKAFAKDNVVERAAAPVEVYILDKMPLTAIGKVNKRVLRVDAIRRHFVAETSAIDTHGGDLTVNVVERPSTGVTIVIDVKNLNEQTALRDELAQMFEPYTLASEINFG